MDTKLSSRINLPVSTDIFKYIFYKYLRSGIVFKILSLTCKFFRNCCRSLIKELKIKFNCDDFIDIVDFVDCYRLTRNLFNYLNTNNLTSKYIHNDILGSVNKFNRKLLNNGLTISTFYAYIVKKNYNALNYFINKDVKYSKMIMYTKPLYSDLNMIKWFINKIGKDNEILLAAARLTNLDTYKQIYEYIFKNFGITLSDTKIAQLFMNSCENYEILNYFTSNNLSIYCPSQKIECICRFFTYRNSFIELIDKVMMIPNFDQNQIKLLFILAIRSHNIKALNWMLNKFQSQILNLNTTHNIYLEAILYADNDILQWLIDNIYIKNINHILLHSTKLYTSAINNFKFDTFLMLLKYKFPLYPSDFDLSDYIISRISDEKFINGVYVKELPIDIFITNTNNTNNNSVIRYRYYENSKNNFRKNDIIIVTSNDLKLIKSILIDNNLIGIDNEFNHNLFRIAIINNNIKFIKTILSYSTFNISNSDFEEAIKSCNLDIINLCWNKLNENQINTLNHEKLVQMANDNIVVLNWLLAHYIVIPYHYIYYDITTNAMDPKSICILHWLKLNNFYPSNPDLLFEILIQNEQIEMLNRFVFYNIYPSNNAILYNSSFNNEFKCFDWIFDNFYDPNMLLYALKFHNVTFNTLLLKIKLNEEMIKLLSNFLITEKNYQNILVLLNCLIIIENFNLLDLVKNIILKHVDICEILIISKSNDKNVFNWILRNFKLSKKNIDSISSKFLKLGKIELLLKFNKIFPVNLVKLLIDNKEDINTIAYILNNHKIININFDDMNLLIKYLIKDYPTDDANFNYDFFQFFNIFIDQKIFVEDFLHLCIKHNVILFSLIMFNCKSRHFINFNLHRMIVELLNYNIKITKSILLIKKILKYIDKVSDVFDANQNFMVDNINLVQIINLHNLIIDFIREKNFIITDYLLILGDKLKPTIYNDDFVKLAIMNNCYMLLKLLIENKKCKVNKYHLNLAIRTPIINQKLKMQIIKYLDNKLM
jgi:hypothetical protein